MPPKNPAVSALIDKLVDQKIGAAAKEVQAPVGSTIPHAPGSSSKPAMFVGRVQEVRVEMAVGQKDTISIYGTDHLGKTVQLTVWNKDGKPPPTFNDDLAIHGTGSLDIEVYINGDRWWTSDVQIHVSGATSTRPREKIDPLTGKAQAALTKLDISYRKQKYRPPARVVRKAQRLAKGLNYEIDFVWNNDDLSWEMHLKTGRGTLVSEPVFINGMTEEACWRQALAEWGLA